MPTGTSCDTLRPLSESRNRARSFSEPRRASRPARAVRTPDASAPNPGAAMERRASVLRGRGYRQFQPATREPGDPVRAEAIELLACLATANASLRGWPWTTTNLPGEWSERARLVAHSSVASISLDDVANLSVEEMYAEAEARSREVARG